MKKTSIFWMISIVLAIAILATLLFQIIFFINFYKSTRIPLQIEKENAIKILDKNMDIQNSEIEFGKIREYGERKLLQIILTKNNLEEKYIINLNNEQIIKK